MEDETVQRIRAMQLVDTVRIQQSGDVVARPFPDDREQVTTNFFAPRVAREHAVIAFGVDELADAVAQLVEVGFGQREVCTDEAESLLVDGVEPSDAV